MAEFFIVQGKGATVNQLRRRGVMVGWEWWKFPAQIATLDPLPDGRALIELTDGSWWRYKVLKHGRKHRMKAKKLGPNTSARLTEISRQREAWIFRGNQSKQFLQATRDLPLPPISVFL